MITRIGGQAPWEARYGYCRVVRAGRWAFTAGTTATGPDGVLHRGDAYAQTIAAFGIALRALAEAGVSADEVVRTRMYVTDISQQEASAGLMRSSSARSGRWPPWSKSAPWPTPTTWSRSRSRRT